MRSMDGRDVGQAVAEMVRVLTPYESRNWEVSAGSLEWSCWTTAAHVAHDLLAYAGQVAARPGDAYLPFDLVIHADAPPHDLLQVPRNRSAPRCWPDCSPMLPKVTRFRCSCGLPGERSSRTDLMSRHGFRRLLSIDVAGSERRQIGHPPTNVRTGPMCARGLEKVPSAMSFAVL